MTPKRASSSFLAEQIAGTTATRHHHQILAGSYAQVRFTETGPEAALTLPSNTLLFRAEGMQVGLVNADEQVELRRVTLGRDFGQVVEVLEGVGPTDRVILNPSDSLTAGATVRIGASPKTLAAK